MHVIIIMVVLSLAWCLRWIYPGLLNFSDIDLGGYQARWQKILFLFLFPPLLILMTAIAVLCMGPTGQMLGFHGGWFSYAIAIAFLGYAIVWGCTLGAQGIIAARKIARYPHSEFATQLAGQTVRELDSPQIFAAQVGFWRPQLAVSQGMLQALDPIHLEAVLKHEQAHYHYRDTFWFFCLGYIRQVTRWLPHTDALWQELLLLREMRADRWAAQYVDRLVLAEALLWSVSSALVYVAQPIAPESEIFCAAFSYPTPRSRLEKRIDAILDETVPEPESNNLLLGLLVLSLLPLTSIPFHS
ncbi:M56 family metallopeptidase [Pseudanabaena sp. PCC 6802]|uniref:M56 family metallopeptidase n=1 Tax=Pseudanabaena sp. PCC 6802 TaxID=118173 RepID=UPI0003494197|nr:M56 family metallopeptidase [Pseudanabaena sp. PCC 6802]